MEAVGRKLDYVLTADTADLRAAEQRVEALRRQANANRAGLVEQVAYTWFNRLAALRYLDAHHWHPFGCRVLTPATADDTQPELLVVTRSGVMPEELEPFTDSTRLRDLLTGQLASNNPQGEVYRHLVLAACRFYNKLMPFLFEPLDDETELLLPDDLLTEQSIVHGFRTEISDEDCAEVEVIGWLYQYYISDKKDEVMARKKAVPSEDIPAVTQLFTPHWIVRYLVENSLGRLWLNSRPKSRLREHMPYYVEDPEEQPPAAHCLTVEAPEEIKLLDPACGSGHMLTYAFDLLVKIYEEEGHAPSAIPEKIITHNLFGLEICPRAAQLAQFALVCKAREQSRTAFRRPVQPQVMCLQNMVLTDDELDVWMKAADFDEVVTGLTAKWLEDGTFLKHLGRLRYRDLGEVILQRIEANGQLSNEIELLDWSAKRKKEYLESLQEVVGLTEYPADLVSQLASAVFLRKLAKRELATFLDLVVPLGDQLIRAQSSQFRENTETFGSLIQPVLDGEIRNELYTDGYGFIVDYIAEIFKLQRSEDFTAVYKEHAEIVSEVSTRDQTGFEKTFSGLMKILYPHGEATPEEIEELLAFSMECRRRVREHILRIDDTFPRHDFSFKRRADATSETVLTAEEIQYPRFAGPRKSNSATTDEDQSSALAIESEPSATAEPDPSQETTEAQTGHVVIPENRKGWSYHRLFAEHLRGARRIIVRDPYVRMFFQVRNMMEFLQMVHDITEDGDEVEVQLVTQSDKDSCEKQAEQLDQIVETFTGSRIVFSWEYDHSSGFHARHITTDTGWKILLDRGLDFFQKFDSGPFSLEQAVQEARMSRATEITYVRENSE